MLHEEGEQFWDVFLKMVQKFPSSWGKPWLIHYVT